MLDCLLVLIKIVNLYVVNDLYYEGVRILLWNFINRGVLEEVNFFFIILVLL